MIVSSVVLRNSATLTLEDGLTGLGVRILDFYKADLSTVVVSKVESVPLIVSIFEVNIVLLNFVLLTGEIRLDLAAALFTRSISG